MHLPKGGKHRIPHKRLIRIVTLCGILSYSFILFIVSQNLNKQNYPQP
jgi:hypothetical protein